jgi:membrane protease YdiL (CAAX protease family)
MDSSARAGRATLLAMVVSGVAFGLAHLNNLGYYDATFVLFQSSYATDGRLRPGRLS